MDITTWPAIPVLLSTRRSVDGSPVCLQDNGQVLFPSATVSRRISFSGEQKTVLFAVAMGSCPIQILFGFLETADGITIDSATNFLYSNGVDDNQALGGSNITIQCQDGYTNVGGALTIICTAANIWTPFPQCHSVSTTTTSSTAAKDTTPSTVAPALLRCPYVSDTLLFPGGKLADTSNLALYSDNTAAGILSTLDLSLQRNDSFCLLKVLCWSNVLRDTSSTRSAVVFSRAMPVFGLHVHRAQVILSSSLSRQFLRSIV